MFQLTTISIILFITTVINSIAAVIAWQRRKKTRSGLYFALGMVGITFWTLAAGFDYAAVPIPLKVFFATLEAWGYMTAIPLFALGAISFGGYDHWLEKTWVKALFILVPASNILLVSTNGLHGWIWTEFTRSENNIVIFEHGPAFNWIVINGYMTILVIIVVLWLAIRTGSDIARRQGRLLLGATLFPLVANVAYNFLGGGVDGLDWTSVTFSVTGVLFLQALYGTRLWDLAPIARDKLVNSMSDGMIVLDTQDRIIDINEAAARMIGAPPQIFPGKDMADFAPLTRSFWSQQVERETRMELEVGSSDKRYFDALLSPLRNHSQEIIGRLIIFREITDRKRMEMDRENMIVELEKRNAESESLRETTIIVTSSLDVSEVVQKVLQQIKRVIAYDSASVWLYRGTTAHMVGGEDVPDLPEESKRFEISELDPDYPLWSQHAPYVLRDDIQAKYLVFREPPINYIRGWMAIPLKARGRLIGYIALDSKQPGYFTQADAQIALTYANQVSIALENARLFSNLQDELYERQELINELDVKNSELERFARDLRDTQAQLVEQQRALAAVEERQRLGRDMHDSVNQSIHSLMLFSETLIALLEKDQTRNAIRVAERIQESGRQALKEIRLLLYEIQSSFMDEHGNLVDALDERMNMVERRVGIKAEIICDEDFTASYPRDWNENLYWIIVEALNNSIKYAQARSVKVILECGTEQFKVEIKDDGAGFDSGQVRSGGFGMRTMRERAEILGGQLSVESSPGHGTSVTFCVEIGE